MNDNIETIRANHELWDLFINHSNELCNEDANLAIDSLKNIATYRSYKSDPEGLFRAFPDLRKVRQSLELLWMGYDRMTEEELADFAIKQILELNYLTDVINGVN